MIGSPLYFIIGDKVESGTI